MTVYAANTDIRLNTVGYLPDHEKRATVSVACDEFTVVRVLDGAVALRGKARGPIANADTREQVFIADFSALKFPGKYRVDVAGVGQSGEFAIAPGVYDAPFVTSVRAMYLWRCGCAVKGVHEGVTFAHAACHQDDAYLDMVGGGHVKRDSLKGWHDAGDYNKYVVNVGVTVGAMLQAWEQFGLKLAKVKLDLPESGNGIPDYLNEVKWETDWLLTMQAPDGSVYHKVSTKQFGPSGPPENEKTERYFLPWSSAATADFVAMLAKASRAFKPYDAGYAKRLLDAAVRSYAFLQAHPENHQADLKGCGTGGYQTDDPDDRMWAAMEMWEATGDAAYLADGESRLKGFGATVDQDFDWSNVKNLGTFAYLLSKREGRDSALVSKARGDLATVAEAIAKTARDNGYARPLGASYYWGCNGTVARQTAILMTANALAPKAEYVEASLDAINHLFGRNYFARSFVTGIGHNPPLHPHDRRSMGQPGAPTWPGYLVGGGHPTGTDWKDEEGRYDLNEIAINWNGALIYALAAFVGK